jgi:hypothetical protein
VIGHSSVNITGAACETVTVEIRMFFGLTKCSRVYFRTNLKISFRTVI